MKALTLTQPWATLVVTHNKKIETRSWGTKYRGKLAIHAAKGFPAYAKGLCYDVCFKECLQFSGYASADMLPLGAVIGVCELVDVKKIVDYTVLPKGKEYIFGDYGIGRYMWFLENVEMFDKPFAVRGALGLWEWDSHWNENLALKVD